MINELQRPSLTVSLELDIPHMPKVEHEMAKVEIFSTELREFYFNLLDDNALSVKDIKAERTKIRKLMKTIADNRKAMVSAYKEPISDFEETSKRIEKILKETDDRMKSIVDADKAANEDPFAGLSLECSTYTLNVTCSKEQYDELIKFMKEKGIEYR